ncbi:MAG: lipoyl(octanoyl) transferase LipB [Chloroflexota bacterium]
MKTCNIYRLGLVPFDSALKLQARLCELRREKVIPDTLLLLEHPPVITLGRHGDEKNIIAPPGVLEREGIPVFRTERGGDVTCHSPGQLIGYPILDLKEGRITVSGYVWKLEEVVIKTLADFGITAGRSARARGVFAAREKLCALGLRIAGGVSYHGFALNVNTNLRYFDYIVPCGLSGVRVTSMARLLGYELDMAQVKETLAMRFAQEFNLELKAVSEPNIDLARVKE